MKYAIGYQLPEGNELPIKNIIDKYKSYISEVYFPWLDIASGRSPLVTRRGHTDWTAQEQIENDLEYIKNNGIKLDLLLNGNCYGGKALSVELGNKVISIIEHLQYRLNGIDIVTTTSPYIANIIKSNFPCIETRASVNMRIGTIKGMEYVSDLFDSFYIQREYNRNLEHINKLKSWCNKNGKKLYMLANSGCMTHCSGQTFHDNLVAHEAEICETVNDNKFHAYACWRYLKNKNNWVSILQNTWIRPEDIHNYESLFDTVKLATRMHSNPIMVIDAYVRQKFYGNLLDLCEPGYAPALLPYIIDNRKFPDDFFTQVTNCNKQCELCSYCNEVLEKVLVDIS